MFVALPSVQQGLGMTVAARQWVVTAYTLALAGLLLLGRAPGRPVRRPAHAADRGDRLRLRLGGRRRLGRRRHAHRGPGRAGGVRRGAGLVHQVAAGHRLHRRSSERARAIGIFTATLTAGLALGLVLGGVLTSELSWRWCLYVNIAAVAGRHHRRAAGAARAARAAGDPDRRGQRGARLGGHGRRWSTGWARRPPWAGARARSPGR